MFKLFNFKNDENGNGMMICIFILFLMLGVGALVVDTSILYKTKGDMRKAANAAALSGAQAIFQDPTSVNNIVQYVLEAHNEVYSPPSIEGNKLTVTLEKNVPLYFMKIFGVNSVPIEVISSAKVGPLGGASGVIPIGVPDDTDFVVGKEYPLNYTPGNGQQGNFEYLDFSNIVTPNGDKVIDSSGASSSGAGTLAYYIQNGFDPYIDVNYDVQTKTGVDLGPVREAINYRIKSSNPDDRIVVVVLYDHNNLDSGKSDRIITGFACFYLESVNGQEIKGTFIKKVTAGSVNDSAKDRGAYGVQLVE